jgi:hypothetical protein
MSELRALEEEAAGLARSIDEAALLKRQLLDEVLEGERQVALLERKLALEKEMQVGGMLLGGGGMRGCRTRCRWVWEGWQGGRGG